MHRSAVPGICYNEYSMPLCYYIIILILICIFLQKYYTVVFITYYALQSPLMLSRTRQAIAARVVSFVLFSVSKSSPKSARLLRLLARGP